VPTIRLVALDLDGTLLDPSGAVAPRTREAVRAARAAGVAVVLATARRWTGAQSVAAALDGAEAVVVCDGAQTLTFPDGRVLFAHLLPAALAQRTAEVIHQAGMQPISQLGDGDGERLIAGPQPRRARWADTYLATFRRQVEESTLAALCLGRPDPLRIVAFGPLRRVRRTASAVVDTLPVGESIRADAPLATQVLPTGGYGAAELTVFDRSASKGAAVAEVAGLLGVPIAQVMALGDGLNDLSMLRVAGLAVAMGNALPDVKAVAHVVTASNAEDGAARAIERYVLGGDDADAAGLADVRVRREEP
jgi:hydroxymethylpyrimidine pyrophosphatase-like HAD family hydrolase